MKRYTKYKDSGVEWCDQVPIYWERKKIAYCFHQIGSGTTPTSGQSEYYEEGENNWLQTGDLNDTEIYTTSKKITDKALNTFSTLKVYPINSLVIAMYGATIGKMGILKIETTTNQACCVLAGSNGVIEKFVFYWFISMRNNIISLSYGGGQPNINQDIIRNLRLQLPSINEQTQIVTFLDQKTAIIDDLIQKKLWKIELLKDQRISIINHTVTKGLNPIVEVKESREKWLGDIPKHWNVKKLRYLGDLQNGISKDADYFGFGFPFLNYGDVYKNDVLPEEVIGLVNSSEGDRVKYSVNEGDVFFTRTSETIDDIGISSVCMKTIPDCVFSGFVIRFRKRTEEFTTGFSKYYLKSNFCKVFIENSMNLVTRASLSQDILKSLPILLPPIKEQNEIVEYLDKKTSEIDKQVDLENRKIDLLKEYRQSLISEVVTGKIDVRTN